MSLLHFYARSYHFSDIKCLSFYLQKVGQGHKVQFSRLHLPSNGGCAKIVLRDLDILFECQKCKIVRCRKQWKLLRDVKLLLILGILASFQFSKVQMITMLYLQIFLHLYGTRRRVALVYMDIKFIFCLPQPYLINILLSMEELSW